MFKHGVLTAALVLALSSSLGVAARAMPPLAPPVQTAANPLVVEIYGGCGPYRHRGPYGGCRAGGQWSGRRHYVCPPGFHVGPYGRRCWPN